jgi:hypothetical protein
VPLRDAEQGKVIGVELTFDGVRARKLRISAKGTVKAAEVEVLGTR